MPPGSRIRDVWRRFPRRADYRRKLALAHARRGTGYALLEMIVDADLNTACHCVTGSGSGPEFPQGPRGSPGLGSDASRLGELPGTPIVAGAEE